MVKKTKLSFQNASYYTCLLIMLLLTACSFQSDITTMDKSIYQDFRESQKNFISSDGIIKYIDEGDGPVILLLHGIPTSSWLYRKMIPLITAKGYRVISPDMLGFGSSDNPVNPELYSPDQHAKRIAELMSYLEISEWTHVMHDVGGLWTWELLKIVPDRISGLVVLNTILYEEGFKPPVKMRPGAFAKFSMWLYRQSFSSRIMLKQLFKNALSINQISSDELEGYLTPLIEGKTNGMYNFFTSATRQFPDYAPTFEKVEVPKLLIWGKDDSMLLLNPQLSKIKQQMLIKPENIHLLEANHFIQEDAPQLVVAIILNFLSQPSI